MEATDIFTCLPSIEMMQKGSTLSFLGRRSLAPRPLSAATEFEDFDDEEYDSETSPSSMQSLEQDSQSSLSSPDGPRTPQSAGLGGFDFHFDDKSVTGPTGPHLFRLSPEPMSKLNMADDEIFLGMSPAVGMALPKTPTARPFSSLNRAVAELDESQVRDWAPTQVANWMSEAGFDSSVVEKFLTHDISGTVLLDLQFEDLKELDITSYGKRHRVMSSIQHLRNSSMISLEAPITTSPARSERGQRALHRSVKPEETMVVRSSSRRGRLPRQDEAITPAESVSIVAIEQLLPKPHVCSKGEDCPKWRKQQKKIARMEEEFAADAEPSVIGSSDVLGPTRPSITPEALEEVEPRDPQEFVRQFLDFQHMHSSASDPSPPPASSASMSSRLRSLPALTIPHGAPDHSAPATTRLTPMTPWHRTGPLQSALRADPFHYGGVASPADIYRVGTPYSATDIPVTSMPEDPFNRDVSQSVPPEMRYGSKPTTALTGEAIQRPASTSSRRHVRPAFTPSIAPVSEAPKRSPTFRPEPPVERCEPEDVHRAGWMRKRRTTRLLRHEWGDQYFQLKGTKLAMYADETETDNALEFIDVDEFAIACSSMASSSKLSAAFKRSILGSGKGSTTDQSFAFSLVPEGDKAKKAFAQKAHHFSVKSRDERIEWMRDLMLARALHRNKAAGNEVRVNGNLI
jgi:hypothetical protein